METILKQALGVAEQAWKNQEGGGNMADTERLGSGMPRPYQTDLKYRQPEQGSETEVPHIVSQVNGGLPSLKPSASYDLAETKGERNGRPKASRTLTHAERYQLRELYKGRILGEDIVNRNSRSKIERQR